MPGPGGKGIMHAEIQIGDSIKKAIKAGALSRMPVEDMFWGDRVGTVQDPFGYSWSLATHVKDLRPAFSLPSKDTSPGAR